MAGLLACDSSSRRLPGFPTSDVMPFVIAYSGGSAGDLRLMRYTPLPYQALAGTLIRYSIVKLHTDNAGNKYHAAEHPVKEDCCCESTVYNAA